MTTKGDSRDDNHHYREVHTSGLVSAMHCPSSLIKLEDVLHRNNGRQDILCRKQEFRRKAEEVPG